MPSASIDGWLLCCVELPTPKSSTSPQEAHERDCICTLEPTPTILGGCVAGPLAMLPAFNWCRFIAAFWDCVFDEPPMSDFESILSWLMPDVPWP